MEINETFCAQYIYGKIQNPHTVDLVKHGGFYFCKVAHLRRDVTRSDVTDEV
jgi:hypothetical protein